MSTRYFLVAFVVVDGPEGDNAVCLWAKNWSHRRLKVLAKHIARERGCEFRASAFVPRAGELKRRNFPWGKASVFESVVTA